MSSKVIGFRLPEDVAEELEKVSEERGITVTEFLRSLVDETLYPSTKLHDEESDDVIREQIESLSKAHKELTDKVQELSTSVDRIGEKPAGNEIKGILSTRIDETIQEMKTIKNNINNLKDEIDALTINLEAAQNNIGSFSTFVLSSERLFDHLQKEIKSLRSQLESMANSSTKVSRLEAEGTRLATTMTVLKREIKCKPTDEIHTLTYKNGSEHKFRVYKGKEGLVKPHRVAWDPTSDDKYVDLNEPLD